MRCRTAVHTLARIDHHICGHTEHNEHDGDAHRGDDQANPRPSERDKQRGEDNRDLADGKSEKGRANPPTAPGRILRPPAAVQSEEAQARQE